MLLEKMKDVRFWQKVKTDEAYAPLLAELHRLFAEMEGAPILELPYTVMMEFLRSGDRKKGEAFFSERRKMLVVSAILSMIYPEEQKYLQRTEDSLFAICNEYTWVIPAHIPDLNAYIPDFIDLTAAETGFTLAEIYTALEERLSPLIKTRVKMEVERRIVIPFCNQSHNFYWINFHSNWAAVCAGSVGAAFMYLFPERFPEVKPIIDKAMANFLLSYRESGYCYEGISYWEYGFGFFVSYAQLLYDFTGGKENLFDSEKVKAIATFPQKTFLSGNSLISFSDGVMEGTLSLGIWHFLADTYPDAVFPLPQPCISPSLAGGRWHLAIRDFLWLNPKAEKEQPLLTDYSLDAEWLVYRTPDFGFAAKGGTNWEAHNHNDVASFVFAVCGKQVFADLGAGEYTRQYFQEEYRYKYFNPCSRSHNVPILFGNYQKTGGKYRANGTVYDGKTLSFDFASAYDIPEVKGLRRTFAPDTNGVTVTDEITYAEGVTPQKGDYIERFVTLEKPEIQGNQITVGGAIATFTGADAPTVSTELATVLRAPNRTVYVLDFAVTGEKFTLRIEPKTK